MVKNGKSWENNQPSRINHGYNGDYDMIMICLWYIMVIMTMVVIKMIIGIMKMGITIDGDKNNNNGDNKGYGDNIYYHQGIYYQLSWGGDLWASFEYDNHG